MNLIICEDDEAFATLLADRLKKILEEHTVSCSVTVFSTGSAFLNFFSAKEPAKKLPDLIFMDLSLPDADGMDLIRTLHKEHKEVPVVFLTSMEDRIAEGYDVNAFHFLFKRSFSEKLPALIERFLEEKKPKNQILLKAKEGAVLLIFADLYYVEADKRKSLIHTADHTYSDEHSIQNFAKLLPPESFAEVYHALFVNISHIRRVDTDQLTLDNGVSLPVSRRKRQTLMTMIMQRIQGQ